MIGGDSLRNACAYVKDHSPPLTTHKLSKSTLHDLFSSLPPTFIAQCTFSDTSDVLIMDFIQQQQSEQRSALSASLSLLTSEEETMLVQWIEQRQKMNIAVEQAEIIAHARLIIERERSIEITNTMRNWYHGFIRRHPHLTTRVSQNVKKARLTAQASEGDITRYFTLLEQFRHLPPDQIYAADETGLDGDGARRAKVVVPKGTKRPAQQQDSYREHTSLLHIGNAAGDSLPIIMMFKCKDKLDIP
jgi:hypothetical protein